MRLIERVWFYSHPAKYLLVPLLLPLSLIFYLISTVRRWSYQVGIKESIDCDIPVIVVGNIGVGGNGKTPMVLWLIAQCQHMNLSVGVISRGYGAKAPHYPYLLADHSTAQIAGDEPVMIYQRTKVPVAIGADRIAAINLLKAQGVNVIISDDGMQHYRMARGMELCVVDGKRQWGNGLLLPAGPLRELPSRLTTVDYVIINGDIQRDSALASFAGALSMALKASNIVSLDGKVTMSIEQFVAKHSVINACAGIGDPQRFFDQLTHYGFTLNTATGFIDHQDYHVEDFVHFSADSPLLMTEKDAVKCRELNLENAWFVPVDAAFSERDTEQLTTSLHDLSQA